MLFIRNSFQMNLNMCIKVKRIKKKIYYVNNNQKKAGVALLISDQLEQRNVLGIKMATT